MSGSENQHGDAKRTRRNVGKMIGIGGAAFLGRLMKPKRAEASVCFLKGTKIRTASGDRKVEDLTIGDLLPTLFGGMRPVQWIGRMRCPTKPWVKDALPVRITRSALGPNVPHADLYLSQWHSLFIDGVLVPAAYLINGTTITHCDAREFDELQYFHIKLESHDVICAEGAPCDTILNPAVIEDAINFADYLRRYGAPKTTEAPCAPFVGYDGGRSELKSRLRSAVSPWVDRRQKLDIIRDRLEERGIALCRHPALT
jgi:Hint domain